RGVNRAAALAGPGAASQKKNAMRVSVLMAVAALDRAALARSLGSLRAQEPMEWELVVSGPAAAVLADVREPGLRVVEGSAKDGVAAAYERCRARAHGDFLVLLAPGDTLAPSALARAVAVLDADPGTDLVYADEDRVDPAGAHHTPFFRPDWS